VTYAELLEDESIRPNYLAVLKPRRRIDGFSLVSGSVYKDSVTLGQVVKVEFDGVEYTEVFTESVAAGEWYYNTDTMELFVRLVSGLNPNTGYLVATYEIYAGTFDAHWYRNPLNDATRSVYFDPIIKQSPVLKESMSDALFGFAPVESGSITLINAEHWAETHLRDSSFAGADIYLYHWLDKLEVANIKLVMRGLMGDVSYSDGQVRISVKSGQDIFSQEYRNESGDEFFTVDTFANLNPASIAKPIRRFWGRKDGVPATNVDYQDDSPTTSDNRDYVICNGQSGLADIVRTVPASPVSTTTRTYVNLVNGLNVGDTVWIDKASDEYRIITTIGANYIEHDALSVAAGTGDTVKRAFVGRIDIIKEGVLYTAYYNRDYTVSVAMSGGTSGFSFNTSLEANISLPSTLTPNDKILCRVYGPVNNLTLGGPSFGSNSTLLANMARPAQIILDVLKRCLSVTDLDINQTSFNDALSSRVEDYGFALPETSSSNYPKYRDLISKILETSLLQLSLDGDQKWKITIVGPLGSSDYLIEDDEILRDSYAVDFNYNDLISDVIVEYDGREISNDPNATTEQVSQVSSVSSTASFVHKVSQSLTKRVPLVFESDAQVLSDRLSYALGDYQGRYTLKTKNRFFESGVGSIIDSIRSKQPGFSYDGESVFTQKLVVLDADKSLDQINLVLTDQKGIEDNSASW